MPGVNKWREQDKVVRSIVARKLTVRTVKERAKKVLEFVQRCAKRAPEVGDARFFCDDCCEAYSRSSTAMELKGHKKLRNRLLS